MAKYFLGSVGKAEAFRFNGESLELAFVSKTLTDSGLNISTTKDDIRGGEGAPIQFSFYHDPNVEITLTDIQWKKEYLTAQLGAKFDKERVSYQTKEITLNAAGKITVAEAKPLPISCGDSDIAALWAAKAGTEDWFIVDPEEDYAVGKYCVRYLGDDDRAEVAEITSTIIPEELFLIITAPIFAGDACAASNGRAAGHITFEVPRFLLNGGQEFSMNMSSNQTMSLAGIALASESAECEANGGKLLRVIEVIYDRKYSDGVEQIMADPDCLHEGYVPEIYGIKKDGSVTKMDNKDLTFTPALTSGKFATGNYTIAFGLVDSIQVTVE